MKLKPHGLPDALSEEFPFKCLYVRIHEQFIVSTVELILLSWQPILLYNFHNTRVTWLFYHFFKLQVHILHGSENISIFNIYKLWLVRSDVIFSGTTSYYRRCPKISEVGGKIALWWFPDPTLKLNNSRTAWPIPAIYLSFSSILNALSYEMNLFSCCSYPLTLTLLIPSYLGPTLYTGGSSGPPPPTISSTLGCTNLKFCKVLEIPFKVS